MFGLASRLGCSLKGPVTKENSTLRLRNISSPYSTSSSDGKKRESEPPARESFKQHSKTADEVEKLEALLKAAKDPRNAESPVDGNGFASVLGLVNPELNKNICIQRIYLRDRLEFGLIIIKKQEIFGQRFKKKKKKITPTIPRLYRSMRSFPVCPSSQKKYLFSGI